jgi:hypothetical protein
VSLCADEVRNRIGKIQHDFHKTAVLAAYVPGSLIDHLLEPLFLNSVHVGFPLFHDVSLLDDGQGDVYTYV